MAREIVVWCDICLGNDERVRSESFRVGVGSKVRTLDLCPSHADEIVKPLEALLAAYGAPVAQGAAPVRRTRQAPTSGASGAPGGADVRKGKRPGGPRIHSCLLCDATYAARSGLQKHAMLVHGYASGLDPELFGLRCPLCGDESRALAGHIRRDHSQPSTSAAFVDARALGDPHGVVADVLASAPQP